MIIKTLKELMLLLNLYEHDKVTIYSLAEMSGMTERSIYCLKKRLVENGFLEEDGGEYRNGGFLKIYKINHKRIDDFCVKETPIWHIWKRTRDQMSIFQGSRPDWEKIRAWLPAKLS